MKRETELVDHEKSALADAKLSFNLILESCLRHDLSRLKYFQNSSLFFDVEKAEMSTEMVMPNRMDPVVF